LGLAGVLCLAFPTLVLSGVAMSHRALFAATLALIAFSRVSSLPADEVELRKTDSGGKPFTTYLFKSGAKPVLWPVLGPTGKEMTRAYPMREGDAAEKTDHIHQRSVWFTHGDVNGVSFWHEQGGNGSIVQDELVEAEGGKIGKLVTRNSWVTTSGEKLCTDERRLTFGGDSDQRWFDFDVVVTAVADEVKFGDTKEGSFGVRVDEELKVDAKKGGKIVSSEGLTDNAAWGKPAAWVDYHGPVDGEHLGIAILNHPSSLRFPTHWHVRTYGLFAANPFGLGDFTNKKENGDLKLKKGESFALRYRVIFHRGDEKQARIAEQFAEYAKAQKD
jgi:hypothetical protein